MVLRFGRRSQEVDAWPNIDSFLRRFNDPETAETFNESAAPAAAAAASAPHAIDSFGDAFTFFLCPAQITQAAAAAAATGNQHKISAFHCCSCCCFFVAHFAESTIWLRFRVNTFYVPAKPAAAAAAAR